MRPLERSARLTPAVHAASKVLNRTLLVLASFVLAGSIGLAFYAQAHAGRVFEGISAGGVPLSGLSADAAESTLKDAFTAYATKPLKLEANGQTFALTPADAGLSLDVAASVDRAMAWGRTGSLWERSQAWARGLTQPVAIPLVVTVDAPAAQGAIETVAGEVRVAPVDAVVRMDDATPALVADKPGIEIDDRATVAALVDRASRRSSQPVALVTTSVPAAVVAGDLAASLPEAQAAVDAPLQLKAGDAVWHVTPANLAKIVAVDSAGALTVDRQALGAIVETVSGKVDRNVADANVVVGDDGRLTAVPAVEGAKVDLPASVDRLETTLLAGDDAADLVVDRTAPQITTAMATTAAVQGEKQLAAGVALRWTGGQGELDRGDLLRALTIRVNPGTSQPFVFGLDPDLIGERLTEIANKVDQPVQDARFRLVGGKIALETEARQGLALDVSAGIQGVLGSWGSPQPEVKLALTTIEPTWTGKDKARIKLGDDILAEGGTYYGDSSGPRRQNVELASSLLSGWLVAPGAEFSYADNVGLIDEASGFVTGYGIIEQDGQFETAPVVGGGICQVSTTIFHAAFWAGLPIEERFQHPYYLRTYGEAVSGLPGLDAMVNIEPDWALDLKFHNTTDNWIAVVLIADGQNLWSRIIGTNPGWDISVTEPVITNKVPIDPKMYYSESPELPQGQELVVETSAEGFDVSFTRTVRDHGKTIDTYTVAASFAASRNLTLRGTGPADMPSPFA